MIIDKDYLKQFPPNWRELFTFDKRNCGFGNYLVGNIKIGKELKCFVLNPDTEIVMTNFWDDVPDGKKFRIDMSSFGVYGTKLFIEKRNKLIMFFNERKYKNNPLIINTIKNVNKRLYPRISFKEKVMDVHRFIALLFIPNPNVDTYNIINHKNKDPLDFRISNLEWCDTKYNNQSINRNDMKRKIIYINLSNGKSYNSDELKNASLS